MTEKNSTTEPLEAAASEVDLQEGIGASTAGVDAIGAASLALNASTRRSPRRGDGRSDHAFAF